MASISGEARPATSPILRLLSGLAALSLGAFFGLVLPLSLRASGYPWTATAMAATVAPFVIFLLLMALAPGALQRLLRWTRLDLRDGGHAAAAVVMGTTLWFVLGYGAISNGLYAYESIVVRGEEPPPLDASSLATGLVTNLAILVLPPLFYVAFVGEGGPRAAWRALGLRSEGAGRAILVGFGIALLCILALALAGGLLQGFDVSVPENERALEIARSITLAGALGISVGAAISEEIFFRGFLQPRVGVLLQAALFSVAHLSYVSLVEIVVTFALGLLFGLAYKATRNLWTPIAAHFLFNLIMLVAGMYAPDAV